MTIGHLTEREWTQRSPDALTQPVAWKTKGQFCLESLEEVTVTTPLVHPLCPPSQRRRLGNRRASWPGAREEARLLASEPGRLGSHCRPLPGPLFHSPRASPTARLRGVSPWRGDAFCGLVAVPSPPAQLSLRARFLRQAHRLSLVCLTCREAATTPVACAPSRQHVRVSRLSKVNHDTTAYGLPGPWCASLASVLAGDKWF